MDHLLLTFISYMIILHVIMYTCLLACEWNVLSLTLQLIIVERCGFRFHLLLKYTIFRST